MPKKGDSAVASSKSKVEIQAPAPPNTLQTTPQTNQAGNVNIARSPSHESFATDLSLMSLSSLGSEICRLRVHRARDTDSGAIAESETNPAAATTMIQLRRSPNFMEAGHHVWSGRSSTRGSRNSLLQVPPEQRGGGLVGRPLSGDILFEEETEAIRSCGALSHVLGLMKSFSTSDIAGQGVTGCSDAETLRPTVSEVALTGWSRFDLKHARLEYASRSCSTWVAVGDVSSTSQLPSPQAQPGSMGESPAITAADFIRSVNKKVRQMYIRRRVLSTYKALERLTQSELNLDVRQVSANASKAVAALPKVHISTDLDRSLTKELGISSLGFRGANKTLSLTVKDIERDKGKPLTKYERNMMIFNWLQSLDENAFDHLT